MIEWRAEYLTHSLATMRRKLYGSSLGNAGTLSNEAGREVRKIWKNTDKNIKLNLSMKP